MTIALTQYGSKIEVVIDGAASGPLVNPEDIELEYKTGNTIDISVNASQLQLSKNFPIANVTMNTVVINSLATFKTQMAAVFPEANQGGGTWGTVTGTLEDQTDLQAALDDKLDTVTFEAFNPTDYQATSGKDATGGYAGLTLFKINFKNALNTFTSFFTNANTAARTYTFQDRNGTIADDTDLATKQATLVSGTSIKTLGGVSLLGSGDIAAGSGGGDLNNIPLYTALGSTMKAMPFPLDRLTSTGTLVSGTMRFIAVYLGSAQTITGVKWYQGTAGAYTANNYNGVGLYSYSGGTLTLVASSTNDGNIWTQTSATLGTKAFTTPYVATAGIYFIALLWSTSANTTAPILAAAGTGNSAYFTADFTNSAKIHAQLASQTALPTPQAISGIAAQSTLYWAAIY